MNNETVYRTGRTFKEKDEVAKYIPVSNLQEYVNQLIEKRFKEPKNEFQPVIYFNREGNLLEIYWKDDSCYAESSDNKHLTLMKNFETKEIVGIKIYGIHKLLNLEEIPDA